MGAEVSRMEMHGRGGGREGVKMTGRADGATRQTTQGRVKRKEGGGKRRVMLQATQGQCEGCEEESGRAGAVKFEK